MGANFSFTISPQPFRGLGPRQIHTPSNLLLCSKKFYLDPIEGVDPAIQNKGFYTMYILIPKKDSDFNPILDFRGLNCFLKNSHLLMYVNPIRWFSFCAAHFKISSCQYIEQYIQCGK